MAMAGRLTGSYVATLITGGSGVMVVSAVSCYREGKRSRLSMRHHQVAVATSWFCIPP